jgi:hypothetical protein
MIEVALLRCSFKIQDQLYLNTLAFSTKADFQKGYVFTKYYIKTSSNITYITSTILYLFKQKITTNI